MFPGMNPREMQKAMKRLGISQEEIKAEVVIIRTSDKELVIKNPHVTKVNMMGQDSLQVTGDITEVEKSSSGIGEDDIATIIGQANCTRQEAMEALEQSNGNLAEAILRLQSR